MDFATREPDDDRREVADLIAEECRVTLGPFQFEPLNTRGRWRIRVSSSWGSPIVTIKIDVGPPCWLQPDVRPVVSVPIHNRYGFSMPIIASMRLEEILAEKIARLTRMSAARDAFDLVWVASTSPFSGFSNSAVRQIAILKIWVDNHGLHPGWSRALVPQAFDPEQWFKERKQWDDEQIGLLSHPPPSLPQLEADLYIYYRWLRDLTELELEFAACDQNSRGKVVKAIQELENSALADSHLW